MGRGFDGLGGLGGYGCIDREAAINRFRRIGSNSSISMMRPRPDQRLQGRADTSATTKQRRRVASICLLTGLALVASSWTVKLPTAGYDDDRRLSLSSSFGSGTPGSGPTIDTDGVKHFTPHGPYLGRFDRNDARRLELEAKTEEGAGSDANVFQQYYPAAGVSAPGNNENPYRSRRQIAAKDSVGDDGSPAAAGARTLTSKNTAPKRIALVRPFAPFSAGEILQSFDTWDTYWPCTSNPLHPFDTESQPGESTTNGYPFVVDLYLSFSQTYSDAHPSDLSYRVKEDLKQKFNNNGGWNGCFDKLYNIEAGIAPEMDQYEHNNVQTNKFWVNGPNTQFRSIMNSITQRNEALAAKKGGHGGDYYEAVVLLEGDAHVQSVGWMDFLLDEIVDKAPFAILGSSYRGFSWDSFRDELPLALLEHKNGNAIYNITHPLAQHYVQELKEEKSTYFNSIAYDYRLSQMIVEGRDGTPPEFPFPEIIDESTGGPVVLPAKKAKFSSWWKQWGGPDAIKESDVIANWAATNYLPMHIDDGSPIVHGKGAWLPFDDTHHKITLVVTDWDEGFSESLLSTIDSSDHPFSEILVVKSPSASAEYHSLWETVSSLFHSNTPTSIPVRFIDRAWPDFMDVCDAPVSTEFYMVTNSYHEVVENVDLMFSHDDPPRPLIAYTPASSKHCTDYQACVETVNLSKVFNPDLDKVILDFDMVYHTSSRNAFCHEWKKENGDKGELLLDRLGGSEAYLDLLRSGTPRGPTATSYYAYLENSGMADNIYAFTNRLDHGAVEHFRKVREDEEVERHLAALGKVPTQRMVKEVQPNEKPGPPQDAEAVALHMAALQGNFGSVRRMDAVDEGSGRRMLQSTNEEEPGFFSRLWQRFIDFFRRLFFFKTDEEKERLVDVTRYDDTDDEETPADRAPVSPNRAKSAGGIQFAAQTSANSMNTTLGENTWYSGGTINRELIVERPGWLVQKDRNRKDAAFVARQARKKQQKRTRAVRIEQTRRKLRSLFF